MKRAKMSKRSSRKNFRRGVTRTHRKNMPRGLLLRGGYRL